MGPLTSPGPDRPVKDIFWISGFSEERRDDCTRAASQQVVCRRREDRQDSGGPPRPLGQSGDKVTQLVSEAGGRHTAGLLQMLSEPAALRRLSPSQMSSSSTHLLLVPLNLSQKPHASHVSPAPSSILSPFSCVPTQPPMFLSISIYWSLFGLELTWARLPSLESDLQSSSWCRNVSHMAESVQWGWSINCLQSQLIKEEEDMQTGLFPGEELSTHTHTHTRTQTYTNVERK